MVERPSGERRRDIAWLFFGLLGKLFVRIRIPDVVRIAGA